jgi:phosphoserine aminotransferase
MLCVEDALDSLKWAEAMGGLDGLVARAEGNLAAVAAWVERS